MFVNQVNVCAATNLLLLPLFLAGRTAKQAMRTGRSCAVAIRLVYRTAPVHMPCASNLNCRSIWRLPPHLRLATAVFGKHTHTH